jgi:bis(5'-nucleosyl)-tetraphosphatase (symmetrical)
VRAVGGPSPDAEGDVAVYAIGDVQGCHRQLLALLEAIGFDRRRDRLWFTGDLVNRGPDSVSVLRLVRDLGDRAIAVLGNHDLSLLAARFGHGKIRDSDTFHQVLDAPDADELLDWLRRRPMLHRDLGLVLIHAGLAPQWTLEQAAALASELETVLRGDGFEAYMATMFGNRPKRWRDDLAGDDRLRFVTNCLTRMRFCTVEGRLRFKDKGSPGTQAAGYLPWFRVPGRRWAGARVVFGHWASLGLHEEDGVIALDSGCVWGRRLTALRLDGPPRYVSVDCGPSSAR